MTRVLLALPFCALVFVIGVQVGTHNGYALAEYRNAQRFVATCPQRPDFTEWVYLAYPDMILRAIRVAEGVPSFGVMWLAEKYGGHQRVPVAIGRREAAKIVHRLYREWKLGGGCGSFLRFLAEGYAPLNAENDPGGLNRHWAENVALNVAMQLAEASLR